MPWLKDGGRNSRSSRSSSGEMASQGMLRVANDADIFDTLKALVASTRDQALDNIIKTNRDVIKSLRSSPRRTRSSSRLMMRSSKRTRRSQSSARRFWRYSRLQSVRI